MPVDATYTLTPESTTSTSSGGAAAPRVSNPFLDFVGAGLLSPFQRGPSDFVNGSGDPMIKSMIREVLTTRAATDFSDGELPWRPQFGSRLHLLRHRQNTATTAELARVYVIEALAKWVPQVRVKSVITEQKTGPDGGNETPVLLVRVVYDVVAVNRPGNEVLISNESIAVAA